VRVSRTLEEAGCDIAAAACATSGLTTKAREETGDLAFIPFARLRVLRG
jgi:hypothetical protein